MWRKLMLTIAFGLAGGAALIALPRAGARELPTLAAMPAEPAARERALRAAVRQVDALDNIRGQGHGELHIALADIEAGKGNWRTAAQLLRQGLRLGPHSVEGGLRLVEASLRAGLSAMARAHLADLARFAPLSQAGAISDAAARLGLPDPYTTPPSPGVTHEPLVSRPISLLALGAVDLQQIEAVARTVEREFGQRVIVSRDSEPPQPPARRVKGGHHQVEAFALARQAASIYTDAMAAAAHGARLIIVADDLYVGGLNFVWAVLTESGASLVSTARFAHEDPQVARSRLAKQALVSILDQLGAERATHPQCVNANVLSANGLDAKSDIVCDESRVMIKARAKP
jgi:predicted Zn-dependent protease